MGSISVRLAGLVAAAGLLFAGCSDEPVPQEPDPTPTSAAPSPTLTPPVLPEEAKADTSSGAANFVMHWVKTQDYAALTGDTRPLSSISTPDCAPCGRFVELYESTYERGGFFAESERELTDLSVRASDDGDVVLVRATNELSPGVSKDDENAEVVAVDGEVNDITYRVERDRDRWVMAAMALDDA